MRSKDYEKPPGIENHSQTTRKGATLVLGIVRVFHPAEGINNGLLDVLSLMAHLFCSAVRQYYSVYFRACLCWHVDG